MTDKPITAHHGDPISKVRQLFQDNNIQHVPVVNGTELVGMISWGDMLRISYGDAFGQSEESVDVTLDHTFEIEDIMTKDIRSIDSSHSIRDAAVALSESHFHALPVVSGKDLVGIVTTKDLIQYLVSLY